MAVKSSELIIKLIDQVSAPARKIQATLDRINQAARANAARLDAMRGRMVEAAAAGYALARSISAPIKAASEFQSLMLDIGQKADMSDAAIKALGDRIRSLAPTLNKSSVEVAKGIDYLLGVGLDEGRAMQIISPITKAASAYKANIEDLSKAGYAALDNLKVPANEFGRALDAMAQSGKEGAFELRDMAQYLPSLGAAFQGLKQTGVPAVADLGAALQVVRKGAGDSASAATNLENLLQKITAPDALKNFKKFGIDIRKELAKAQKTGKSPIEMIAELTNKALGGDLSKLGDLFQDAQVQKALRPLIQNLDEYRRIRAEALKAHGVVEEDFARRAMTAEARMAAFQARLQNLSITIGNALLPALNAVLDTVGPIAKRFGDWAERNEGLVRTLAIATAGLISFKVAATAAQFAGLFLKGALLQVQIAALSAATAIGGIARAVVVAPAIAAFNALRNAVVGYTAAAVAGHGTALKAMGASLLSLLNPLKVVRAAWVGLRTIMIGSGIGAIVAGIAAAGTFIYNNWSGITVAFEAFKGAFDRAIAPIKPALEPVTNAISGLFDWVNNLLGPIDESGASWARWGIAAGNAVGDSLVAVVEFTKKIGTWATDIGKAVVEGAGALYDAGSALIQKLWDGITDKFDQLVEWLKGLPGRIVSAIGSIDLSGLIKMPNIFGGGAAAPAGTRAMGGPVSGGSSYLVGERGPELFTPSASGSILPAGVTKALRPATVAGGVASAIPAMAASPPTTMRPAPQVTQHFTINVQAGGVTDPRRLAEEIMREAGARSADALHSAFYDLG